MNIELIKKELDEMNKQPRHTRSKWARGVGEYAAELLEDVDQINPDPQSVAELREAIANGADSWEQFSWGGCSLIYDHEIAERLSTPSELKRTNGGQWRPNKNETWLDVQARALFQASIRIRCAFINAQRKQDERSAAQ